MNVREATNRDEAEWNEFVAKFSDSPYHIYGWKKLFEDVYNYECRFLVAENDGEVVGILPLAVTRSILFGFWVCSLPFLDYGGPLIRLDKNDVRQVLRLFSTDFPYVDDADFFEIRSPPQQATASSLQTIFEPGNVKYLSFLIKLEKSFDKIWRSSFDSDLRKKIRRAGKHGISIIDQDLENGVADFFHTYLLAMKKLGSPPHKLEFFASLPKMLGAKRVKFFQILKGTTPIGGALVFLGGTRMYYGYEVIDPQYKSLRPGYLLYSEMLRWGCERGFEVFDTGRTLHGSGVYLFKKQWGGQENQLPYFYAGKRIPRADPREKYSLLSQMWGKFLPLGLTEKIGWHIKAGVGQ
jgi:FemAB-related protein (PEP-CTERM system-associated)